MGLESLPTLARVVDPIKEAIDLLKVSRPDRMARILQISFRAISREEAVRMVEAVTESYRKFLEDTYEKRGGEVVSLITRARDDLSKELSDLEQEYTKVRKNSSVPIMDKMGDSFLSRRLEAVGPRDHRHVGEVYSAQVSARAWQEARWRRN